MNEKRLAVITPMALLVIIVVFAQFYVLPQWLSMQQTGPAEAQPKASNLQILGYNYNKDLVEISVVLWNRGNASIAVNGVSYDGVSLKMGVVGSPNDLTTMTDSHSMNMLMTTNSSSRITANDIIFPDSNHWNMYTAGAAGVSVIQPNGLVTLFLGVTSLTHGSTHTLLISSGSQQYAFLLQR